MRVRHMYAGETRNRSPNSVPTTMSAINYHALWVGWGWRNDEFICNESFVFTSWVTLQTIKLINSMLNHRHNNENIKSKISTMHTKLFTIQKNYKLIRIIPFVSSFQQAGGCKRPHVVKAIPVMLISKMYIFIPSCWIFLELLFW